MKGIMFKEDLFRAVVEGRKTETRRVVKPQPKRKPNYSVFGGKWIYGVVDGEPLLSPQPRHFSGEVVYLKEPWWQEGDHILYGIDQSQRWPDGRIERHSARWGDEHLREHGWEKKNKMFMPASAARYFVKVTSVRCDRLQDITANGAIAEGITLSSDPARVKGGDGTFVPMSSRHYFAALWDSINKPPVTWKDNPWVWVYRFELCDKDGTKFVDTPPALR